MMAGNYVALEGFTETLEKELDPAWNIKVRATRSSIVPPHC